MTGKRMNVLLTTLFASLESNYVELPLLKNWADQCIESTKQPSRWLIDLSLASSTENALDILRLALPEYGVMLDQSYGKLLLGFLYQRLNKGGLSREDFDTECIDIIDAYEVHELDGSEIVDGSLSASLTKSLKIWATTSGDSLNRVFEMRFNGEETLALGVT